MHKCELVIFDCDGVLVDSERISNRVFRDMLAERGVSLTLDDMFEHFVGLSMRQCMERVSDLLGAPTADEFIDIFQRREAAALASEVTPVPGVAQAIASMALPCCVASSGSHDKIRLTLGTTGLLGLFQNRIFSVSDVAHPKPAPDVYLHAARTMQTEPGHCVVVEDSPAGVRAGVAAGMQVLGFARDTPARRLQSAGAGVIFNDMTRLPPLLNGLMRRRA